MVNEYEIITHKQIRHFHVFLVNLLYRVPHLHKDFELCLILEGDVQLTINGQQMKVHTGDLFLINPYQVHELRTDNYALILSVQVFPSFFYEHYPRINSLFFPAPLITKDEFPDIHPHLYSQFTRLASAYFLKQEAYELECSARLNYLFYLLVTRCPYQLQDEKDQSARRMQQKRIRHIINYIDENYSQKLLLSDIARQEGLTVTYLSHFFSETIGISFQEYLTRIRCEKARYLLLFTDQSLLDISIACGFSDPKYFNSGFLRQYGSTPKEYRRSFYHETLPVQQQSLLTTQEFLSDSASIIILKKHVASLGDEG